MKTSHPNILLNILNRASVVGTATSIAFVVEELVVALLSTHMKIDVAYFTIRLFISYLILFAAFVEPIVEFFIDDVNAISKKLAKSLATKWYILLDVSYSLCISLYFFDSFNNKSFSYWYAVVLPSVIIAFFTNKELRIVLNLFPTTNSSKLHNITTHLLDVSCEAIRGFILGYDVISEIGYEFSSINSLYLSISFGLFYGLFHGIAYHFIQKEKRKRKISKRKFTFLDHSLQTTFTLLTIIFFSLYILETLAKTNPHLLIQITGYAMIITYIITRPLLRPRNPPLLDKIAEEDEKIRIIESSARTPKNEKRKTT